MSDMLIVGSVAFDTLHFKSGSHPKVLGGSAVFPAQMVTIRSGFWLRAFPNRYRSPPASTQSESVVC